MVTRSSSLTPTALRARAQQSIFFSIEAFDDRYLKSYNKRSNVENNARSVEICNRLGIHIMGLFILDLDFTGRFSGFNARVSYVFYILHYPLVVLCQYFLGRAGLGSIANFVLTLVICYPLTFALCAAVDKSRYIRVLFGSKAKRKEQVN